MSKKVKYIISISLVVLILSLGIITLIMGLVPVGGNDAINLPNDVYIYTNLNGSDSEKERGKIELHRREGSNSSDDVNKIFDLFNDGFKQKALSAMFKGELGAGLEFVDNYAINNKDNSVEKYKDDLDKITIVFCYNDKQKVTNADTNCDGYKYLFFTVTASTDWQNIIFGLAEDKLNEEEREIDSHDLGYQYSFNGKMVTNELYNYVRAIIERNLW